MRMRNGEHGYGAIAKLLHWLTVSAFAAQFVVGYSLGDDDVADEDERDEDEAREVDCDPPGEDVSGGDLTDAEKDRLDQLEEECELARERAEEQAELAQELPEEEADDPVGTAWDDLISGELGADGLSLPEVHVLLGLAIIALGVLRLAWRRLAPLPPWDPRLTRSDRGLVGVTEKSLLTLQLVVPATGLALVAGGDDDLLWLHIAGHVAFFVVLGAHLLMVLGKGLLPRMLPGGRVSPPDP